MRRRPASSTSPGSPSSTLSACWQTWVSVFGLLLVRVLGGSATSGFTGSVFNQADTHATGTEFLKSVAGAVTQCDAKPASNPVPATAAFACTGNTFPATLASSGTTTFAHTLTNSGTISPKSATYSASACGPVQLANTLTTVDPMLVHGTVSFAQSAGPLTGSTALSTDRTLDVDATGPSSFVPGQQRLVLRGLDPSDTVTPRILYAAGGPQGIDVGPQDVAVDQQDVTLAYATVPAGAQVATDRYRGVLGADVTTARRGAPSTSASTRRSISISPSRPRLRSRR